MDRRFAEAMGRSIVRERSHGICELRIPHVCLGRAMGFSHRLPAGAGGDYSPCNGLDACGSGTTGCHGHIEAHRTWAYDRGLLLLRGADPITAPARLDHPLVGPGWWTLNPDGSLTWSAPYEQERPWPH